MSLGFAALPAARAADDLALNLVPYGTGSLLEVEVRETGPGKVSHIFDAFVPHGAEAVAGAGPGISFFCGVEIDPAGDATQDVYACRFTLFPTAAVNTQAAVVTYADGVEDVFALRLDEYFENPALDRFRIRKGNKYLFLQIER